MLVFLSETVDISPGSCVGGFGLALSSFLLCVVLLFRFEVVACAWGGAQFARANRWALVCGAIAAVGALGVAAFQYRSGWQGDVHLAFAAMFFIGATLWMLLNTYLDYQLRTMPRGCALGVARVGVPAVTVALLVFTLVTNGTGSGSISRNVRDSWNEVQAGVEISLFLTNMAYVGMQYFPFRKLNVRLEIGNDGTGAADGSSALPLLI